MAQIYQPNLAYGKRKKRVEMQSLGVFSILFRFDFHPGPVAPPTKTAGTKRGVRVGTRVRGMRFPGVLVPLKR